MQGLEEYCRVVGVEEAGRHECCLLPVEGLNSRLFSLPRYKATKIFEVVTIGRKSVGCICGPGEEREGETYAVSNRVGDAPCTSTSLLISVTP